MNAALQLHYSICQRDGIEKKGDGGGAHTNVRGDSRIEWRTKVMQLHPETIVCALFHLMTWTDGGKKELKNLKET